MGPPRFHLQRKVRLHASGLWVVTVGRHVNRRGELIDTQHYFQGSQVEATDKANAVARQWKLLCQNWQKTEQQWLELEGKPFASIPHWTNRGLDKRSGATTASEPAPEDRHSVAQHDDDEIGEAVGNSTFAEFITMYDRAISGEPVMNRPQQQSLAKDLSQMRGAARALPTEVPALDLKPIDFQRAKSQLFEEGLSSRTVRNYLTAALKLLTWGYARFCPDAAGVPLGIRKACTVRKGDDAVVVFYSLDQLRAAVTATRGTRSQLDLLLALNCGMTNVDIGRLQRAEIDLKDGGILWDREKQPNNKFRIYHQLWPETLRLVKRYLNDGRVGESYVDYRQGRKHPLTLDARDLAFLADGRPRYLIKPSGSAEDRVGEAWETSRIGIHLRNVRRTASDTLVKFVQVQPDFVKKDEVAQEVKSRFLGHKDANIERLYEAVGKEAYKRMNHYLDQLGERLREEGVFGDVV